MLSLSTNLQSRKFPQKFTPQRTPPTQRAFRACCSRNSATFCTNRQPGPNNSEEELVEIKEQGGLVTKLAYAGGYLDTITDFAGRRACCQPVMLVGGVSPSLPRRFPVGKANSRAKKSLDADRAGVYFVL